MQECCRGTYDVVCMIVCRSGRGRLGLSVAWLEYVCIGQQIELPCCFNTTTNRRISLYACCPRYVVLKCEPLRVPPCAGTFGCAGSVHNTINTRPTIQKSFSRRPACTWYPYSCHWLANCEGWILWTHWDLEFLYCLYLVRWRCTLYLKVAAELSASRRDLMAQFAVSSMTWNSFHLL